MLSEDILKIEVEEVEEMNLESNWKVVGWGDVCVIRIGLFVLLCTMTYNNCFLFVNFFHFSLFKNSLIQKT